MNGLTGFLVNLRHEVNLGNMCKKYLIRKSRKLKINGRIYRNLSEPAHLSPIRSSITKAFTFSDHLFLFPRFAKTQWSSKVQENKNTWEQRESKRTVTKRICTFLFASLGVWIRRTYVLINLQTWDSDYKNSEKEPWELSTRLKMGWKTFAS